MNKIDVSIIIVNYNTSKLILSCIDSIEKYTSDINYEIIIVDNNSSKDCSLDILQKDKRITFVQSKDNLGFGRANNLGVQYSSGDYLFFLNPDTLLINNAIFILFEYLSNHSDTAIVGGNLFDENQQPIHSFKRIFPSFFSEFDVSVGRIISKMLFGINTDFNHTECPMDVAQITGADLMIKRDVFELLKGFDSDFFMYYEETDLCYRTKNKGFAIKSCPNAKIIHLEGKSITFSSEREKRFQDGRYVYFHKHYGMVYNFFTDMLNICSLCMASIIFSFSLNTKEKYVNRLKIYINNSFRRNNKKQWF